MTTNNKKVLEIAQKWAGRVDAKRLEKAVALVDYVTVVDETTFRIEGTSDTYTVSVDRTAKVSRCTCPDHQQRAMKCKHILACALREVANRSN
jgi:uncharacterized Zn finger protein